MNLCLNEGLFYRNTKYHGNICLCASVCLHVILDHNGLYYKRKWMDISAHLSTMSMNEPVLIIVNIVSVLNQKCDSQQVLTIFSSAINKCYIE